MLHSELRFAGFRRTTEMERSPVRPERRVVENVRRRRRRTSRFPSLLRGFANRTGQDYFSEWWKERILEKAQGVPVLVPSHVGPLTLQQTAQFAAFTCTKHFSVRSHPEDFKCVAWTADEDEIPASSLSPLQGYFYCVAWWRFVLPPPRTAQKLLFSTSSPMSLKNEEIKPEKVVNLACSGTLACM